MLSFLRKRSTSSGGYRRGDIVTIRPLAEIQSTLDGDWKCEGVPFMPEMVRFCGQSFRVERRVERTCVEGMDGPQRMEHTVVLEGLRCDGSAHQGCQRSCLFFWKEAWLRPGPMVLGQLERPTPAELDCAARWPTIKDDRFYCQSTELAAATRPLPPGDWQYYLHDFWHGEVPLARMLYVVWLMTVNFLWRRLFHCEYYRRPAGTAIRTQNEALNLQPGEWVEVRSAPEIRATLDAQGRNRGLTFESEMLACCGRRFRVRGPIQTIIAETTGKLRELRNTVLLEDSTCKGICIKNCPRAHYFFWRESWLRRVPGPVSPEVVAGGATATIAPECLTRPN